MSLITRCPSCGTAFRVQRAQLAARSGRVRCGKCAAVFDAVASLVEEGAEQLALEPSPQLGLFDPNRRNPEPPPGGPEAAVPAFMAEAPARRRTAWLWALLAVAALAALLGQAAHRFRAELAAQVPAARAPLAAGCRVLGCIVQLPRRAELMSIDSSELQADPRRQGIIVLDAVIRNRARFPQEFPALELTLTDDADRPVLRRVLRPGEYLAGAAGARLEQGIAAGSEAALRVYLDSSRSAVTGYRLYLFYPS